MKVFTKHPLKTRTHYTFLNLEEQKIFYNGIKNDKHRLVFMLMGMGGLRVSEVCGNIIEMTRRNFIATEKGVKNKKGEDLTFNLLPGIRMKDISFAKRVILIHGKGDKKREMVMADTVFKELKLYVQNYCQDKGPDDRLIELSRIRIYLLAKRYGKLILNDPQLHPHAFRHSFGTALYMKGVPIGTIAEMMGHGSVKMAEEIYIHISQQIKKESISALDELNWFQKLKKKWRNKRLQEMGQISQRQEIAFIGRKDELKRLSLMPEGKSIVVYGGKGVGKTALIGELMKQNPGKYLYTKERPKKDTLIELILEDEELNDVKEIDYRREELNKEFKTNILAIKKFHKLKKTIIFDPLKLSDGEKNDLRILKEKTRVILVTSSLENIDLLDLEFEVKDLDNVQKFQIVNQMIHVLHKEEVQQNVMVNKVLRKSKWDLNSAQRIIAQLENGLEIDEIRDGNESRVDGVSIAPLFFLLLSFLSFYMIGSALGTGFAIGFASVVLLRYMWSYFKPKSNMKKLAE